MNFNNLTIDEIMDLEESMQLPKFQKTKVSLSVRKKRQERKEKIIKRGYTTK